MTAAAAGSSGIPASLHLPIGKIFLGYPIKPFKKEGEGGEDKQQHQFFEGKGISLREAKKKGNNNGEWCMRVASFNYVDIVLSK